MSTVLYYFSGTGNSLYIAKELAAALGGEIRAIANTQSIDPASDTIGIVFPVYFGGLPRMVLDFIQKSAIEGRPYIFAVATYGAYAGHSLVQLDQLLAKADHRLSAGFGVHLPGNYLVKYGAFPMPLQTRLLASVPAKVKTIAESVKKRETKPLKKGLLTHAFVGYYDKVIREIPTQDRDFRIGAGCTNCGTCERVCPRQNIIQQDGKRIWQHNCEHCMACMQWCPAEAIQYGDKTKKRKRYHNPQVSLKEILLR